MFVIGYHEAIVSLIIMVDENPLQMIKAIFVIIDVISLCIFKMCRTQINSLEFAMPVSYVFRQDFNEKWINNNFVISVSIC